MKPLTLFEVTPINIVVALIITVFGLIMAYDPFSQGRLLESIGIVVAIPCVIILGNIMMGLKRDAAKAK
jgi:biopolymer transport protein ExbB/TolQ